MSSQTILHLKNLFLEMTFGHIPGMTNEMPAKESIPAIRPNHNSWKDPALGSSEWTNDATI